AGGKWYPKRMVRNGGADRYNQLFIMLDTPEKVDEALFKWPQGAPEPGTTPVNNNRVVLVGTAEAKEMEVRQKTEESLYLILNGCERYKQRQGRWPESLQVLVDGNYITAERLVNPRRPDAKPGWGYRVSRNAEMEPMVWEMFEKWPTEGAGKDFPAGIFVAHYGSVKVVVKEEEFKRLVEDP
ncbi:MAG TPA: hypothetical protein VHM90_05105, partial [Phycisphaerae bacterium]|nr:hypothetical protein [Phycisphaerae bacterium]